MKKLLTFLRTFPAAAWIGLAFLIASCAAHAGSFSNGTIDTVARQNAATAQATADTKAAKGANTDITSLTGLTGAVSGASSYTMGSGTTGLKLQPYTSGSWGAIYSTSVTPSGTNYAFATNGTGTNINAGTSVAITVGGAAVLSAGSSGIALSSPLSVANGGTGATTALAAFTNLAGAQSAAGAGYAWSGNILFQWATVTTTTAGTTWTYPIAFPHGAFVVLCTAQPVNVTCSLNSNPNASNVTLIVSSGTNPVRALAIGY